MSQLALYLLGPPRLELDGEEIHISRRKAVALLAYLAVTGRSHSRDSLATLLWPELDQSTARARLRGGLAVLRKAIGDGWLDADRDTLGLNPDADVWMDVDAFHERLAGCERHAHPPTEACPDCLPLLEEAVALYRDHFLAGFTLRDSTLFDEWQFFETEGLKDELAGALVRLATYHTLQGDFDPAIGYARRWLALDPLHEPAHRHLMRLYAQSDQRAAALRQYQLCEQTLVEELGLLPSEETKALYERIRSGEEMGREQEAPTRPPHNLPPQPTPFVGREKELADLGRLIGDPEVRLVTVTGPGGIGKTRLALAAAQQQLDVTVLADSGPTIRFPHGVYFVPLAELVSPDQVIPAMAQAMSRSFLAEREPRQQMLDYLRGKRLLLLMDNLEHLLSPPLSAPEGGAEGGAELLAEILETAPGVQILATSRERLHLRQEQAYPLQGLACPDWETPTDVPTDADPAAYDAVNLFLHSGRRVQPHFQLAEDTLPPVARICRLVEGMPLGIELAAAWVDVLSPEDIAAETQHSLDFLEADWRDMPPRHRSVRAACDASWARLSQSERDVFPQLCVFCGGFTRQAAQEVAKTQDGSPAPLRTLAALVEKSLLQYDQVRDRYQIHELLRQCGSDELGMDPDREAAVHHRHCTTYCAWLEARGVELERARQQAALAEIEADIDNAQAAWRWAVTQRKVACIDRAIDGLCGFFELCCRYQDGERTAGMAVSELRQVKLPEGKPAAAEHQRALAKARAWQARFNEALGRVEAASQLREQSLELLKGPALAAEDTRAARALAVTPIPRPHWAPALEEVEGRLEQGLALYRALGNQWRQAEALLGLAQTVSILRGAFDEAERLYQESLTLFQSLGNQGRVADALTGLGAVARGLGAHDQAKKLWKESLALSEAHNNLWGMADSLANLGHLDLFQGRFEQAIPWLERSVAQAREIGDRYALAIYLSALGHAYALSGDFAQACVPSDEAVAIGQALVNPSLLGYMRAYRARLDVHMGGYHEARTQAQAVLTIIRDVPAASGTVDVTIQRVLGWAALADKAYVEAAQWLERSIAGYRAQRTFSSQEWLAWSLAGLGLAVHGMGNRSEAQAHLLEALEITVDMGAFIPLLHLMPIIPVMLADAGEIERAVELYALAESHPFVANSRLFEDIAGRFIEAAAATLPPEVTESAQERGRTLDWWDTAAGLLKELPEMGWTD
jgi:DNA-binding SARP family transcriptional activator/predicted ATPase